MKKILVRYLILILVSVSTATGSPLIFKTEKTIKNQNEKQFAELAVVDVSKYRQIRVAVQAVPSGEGLIRIEGLEGSELIFIERILFNDLYSGGSVFLETPPNKIRISVRESGTYKIFIWGQ
jgi:hypothetical protein